MTRGECQARHQGEQDKRIDTKFAEQDKRIAVQFADERSYIRQLIQEELADIRERLERLSERTDEDHRAAIGDIERLKKRLTVVEAAVAKLQSQ